MDQDTAKVDETVTRESEDELSDETLTNVVGGLTPVAGESTDDKHKDW
jgi:hypothetical protein